MSPRQRGATGSADERVLLSASDLARTVARMAHQIIEKTALDSRQASDPGVLLVGIPSRGTPLAARLAARIAAFSQVNVPTGALDVTLYRDDLRRKPTRPLEPSTLPAGGVEDRLVILVDDVLFSGRTVRAALDALRDHGRPSAVQLAVLVDRGHRELPIRADYVGKNIPTARGDDVVVLLDELDGEDAVLVRAAADPSGQREGRS